MPRVLAIAAAIAIATVAGCTVGDAFAPDHRAYLALVERGAPMEIAASEIESRGATFDRFYSAVRIARLTATERQVDALLDAEIVLAIEPVVGAATDPLDLRPVSRAESTQVIPWGVAQLGPEPPTGAALWVLDTGVDLGHPDLVVDAGRSIDLVDQFDPGEDEPDESHATAVAGVAAALDNDRDVVGVAPGATVISVRVLDSGGEGRSDVLVAGLDHVALSADPGDVVNLSLAAPGPSAVIDAAVARLADTGVLVVLAAGNDRADVADHTPAGLEHPGVFTVSAIDQMGCQTSFSNFGAVDIAAPGADIVTLRAGGGIAVTDGTSFAAPHFAGLLLSGGHATTEARCEEIDAAPVAIRE